MLKNNNEKVISRMAKQSLKSNRRRSLIMVIAVVLSAFMLFSVFTVGITYFKMQKVQNLRLNGGEYDAILYGLTKEQQEICEKYPDMKRTGTVVVCGFAEETEKDRTPNVGFVWADDTYWNQIKKPARKWMKGSYPVHENEVMVTKSALEACGLEGLEVGDTFMMKYADANGSHRKEFQISGMWEGYGDTEVFYMSKAYFDRSGWSMYDVTAARYYMDFEPIYMPQKEREAFIESMELEKQQNLFFLSDYSHGIEILLGILGIVLITCFCAYLLVYNILYLAVSGNVRYYGLLQTVGMTGKQLHRFMYRQMRFIAIVGMTMGLTLGSIVAIFLLPTVVKTLGIREQEVTVLFHPAVFLLTIAVTGFTVYIRSRKPVKMAVSISPVEALGYRTNSDRKSIRKTGKGNVIFRMAKEQVTKDKKKTAVVILSLTMSLFVFLALVTLLKSQGARTIVGNFMNLDLVVENDTLKMEDRKNWMQIMDEKMLEEMEQTEGVKELHTVTSAEIMFPWEPDFVDMWMEEEYDMWMRYPYEKDKKEHQEHPENFGSFMVGIDETDFDYLNKLLKEPVDKTKFLAGETCIVYRNNLDFKDSELTGKKVTCAEYGKAKNIRTFEVAGVTDENYYTGALLGMPPTLIVSEQVVRKFAVKSFVSKAGIRYDEEYDEETENALMKLLENSAYSKDFSYDSKIRELKEVEKAQGNLMGVGIGIVAILALIGILNYVNTVTGNIQNRRTELAILESIGMTEKQVRQMLVTEGLIFAGSSLFLTATFGTGITYYLYQSMNYRGVPFEVPFLPVVAMAAVVIIVCVTVPLIIQRMIVKGGAVVERIRGVE